MGVAFEQAAKNITVELQAVARAFSTLATQAEQLQGFKLRVFDQTQTEGIDAFNAKIQAINEQLPFFAQKIQEVTPAQYQLVQALIATGSSANEAFAALDNNALVLDKIRSKVEAASAWYGISAQTAQEFAFALSETAITSAEAAGFAEGLAQAVANGLPVEQAMIALLQFKANAVSIAAAAQIDANVATEQALVAEALFTEALTQEALAKANSQIQGEALKVTQQQLYDAALAAAQGMGATQQSAELLASQFGITAQSAYSLIAALSQLEVAKAKEDLGVQAGGANEREDRLGTNQEIIARAKDAKLRAELAKVQHENAVAAADAAGKVALEKDALARLNKGTVEYEKQVGKVQAAERALAAEQERKAKKSGGAPKLTPNEKINTKLLDDQDKFNDKFEDAEEKHWDKVADIYAAFNKKQQEQFAKNEVSKRRSRADFYAGLQDAPAGVDTQKFAAQYEEAFAKAQEIAQSGKAKLASEFLELRQKQIEEMKQLDEEAASIRADQKEGKVSQKDAENQLAYLEGRRKLIEDAQREEQQLLIANGDENQNQLKEQLTAEEQAYQESFDKIGLGAERAAEAKIKHAERSKIAVSEENKELAKQAGIYDDIARKNGGVVPNTAIANTASIPASTSKETDIRITAKDPIPVATAEGLLIRQNDVFLVRDTDTVNSISDMATRIETQLGNVITAVNTAKEGISNAVSAVERAVGSIRISAPSVVGN